MRLVLCAYHVLAAASLATTASANLLVNSGFESGGFDFWVTTPAAVGSNFVVGGDSHSGQFGASFAATGPAYDSISQIADTIAGQSYTLTFWIKNFGVGGDSLRFFWQGALALDMTIIGTELESWVEVSSGPLLATGAGSEVRFDVFDGAASAVLDDICLTLVPTPGSACLAALGLTAAAFRRRR